MKNPTPASTLPAQFFLDEATKAFDSIQHLLQNTKGDSGDLNYYQGVLHAYKAALLQMAIHTTTKDYLNAYNDLVAYTTKVMEPTIQTI